MKFNRKGKTVFAIALTACMAGMAFSALPLLSVQAVEECKELKSCQNGKCDQNGYNEKGPCTTYTFEATEKTTWQDLENAAKQATCTGWTFEGWYTKELEYRYWGDKCEVFGCSEDSVLFPKSDWKCALEFAEYYTNDKGECKVTGVKSNLVGNMGEDSPTTYYYKELFNRWLTRFKDETCEVEKVTQTECEEKEDEDQRLIKATHEKIQKYKVTNSNFNCTVKKACEECEEKEGKVTLYARMKPQVVQIKFLSKKPDSQKAKEDPNRPGLHYADVSQYIRIYRQYGTPLGEIFKDIGDVQFGRTLTGWRKEGETETLKGEDGLWIATTSAYVNYWWCPKALKDGFVKHTPGEVDLGTTHYDWSLDLYAVYKEENDVDSQAEKEKAELKEKEQAAQQKGMLKSAANDAIEAEHTCGNGTLVFKEATCQATGIKAHFQCSCGLNYWDQGCTKPVEDGTDFTTEMHHNLIKIQGKKATCTEEGRADRWVCNTCHKNFTDATGEHEASDFTIEALGHEYKDQGNGTQVCTRCGNVVASEKKAEPEVKPQDQPQVQPQAQEQPTIEEEKKEAPKTETKQEVKEEEVKKEEVKEETKPEPKQETTAPQTPVAPEKDEEEEKDEVVVEREQQTRPSSRRSARA